MSESVLKKLRIAICLAFSSVVVIAASAQRGVVTGTVVDAFSGRPLMSANVSIAGTTLGASTAANGRFVIRDVDAGLYRVRASSVGFETVEVEAVVSAGRTTRVTFRLDETWVEIPEVVVERALLTGGFRGIESLPGSAHFISPAELETFSYNDVGRVLRGVPGVNVQEEDGYGLHPNIGLRGSGSERSSKITVMEDGVLIAPAPYAAPAAYYFPTIGRMEAVEVRKGSSQIKFGPYTTGGALNLVSTRIPARFTGRMALLAGNDDNRTIHASVGDSFGRVGFLVETYQNRSDGFKELDGGGRTGYDKRDYLAKVRFSTARSAHTFQSLTLKAGHADEISDETYLGLTDADFARTPNRRYAASQKDVMKTDQTQLVARHVIKPARWLDITTTLYRTDFSRNWYKLDKVRTAATGTAVSIAEILKSPDNYALELALLEGEAGSPQDALDVKANNRSYYAMGVQAMAGMSMTTGDLSHEIELGIRIHQDEIDRFQWIDSYRIAGGMMDLANRGIPGSESNRVERADAVAAYVQTTSRTGRVSVTPGLRYEHVTIARKDYGKSDPERVGVALSTRSNTVGTLIPGIGVDYRIGRGLHAFAGVHRGFAPPGSREGTRPESSVAYEVGSRLVDAMTYLEAVVFFNDYENLLGADLAASGGQGTNDQFNGGRVDVYGMELSARQDLGVLSTHGHSVPLTLTYTYTSAHFRTSFESEFEAWGTVARGDELPYVPRHQLGVSVGFETTRYSIDLSGKYTGRMRTEAGSGSRVDGESTDAHLTVDIAATYHVNRHVSLFGRVLNATDVEYIAARRPAGIRPGLPRQLSLGVKTRF